MYLLVVIGIRVRVIARRVLVVIGIRIRARLSEEGVLVSCDRDQG